MKEVYKDTPLNRSVLTSIPFWVQIHNVSVLKRTEQIARSFGGLLGTVLGIDHPKGRHGYPFLRVRVEMDIRGSLPKKTTLVYMGEDVKIEFKYESLFLLYFWCGLLDHVVKIV